MLLTDERIEERMPLPEQFVKRGLELATGARVFGKLFSDMTRDELIATAAQGWNAEREQRERHYAESKAIADWYVQRATLLGDIWPR